jgi:predicted PurR-regulated permease PerM
LLKTLRQTIEHATSGPAFSIGVIAFAVGVWLLEYLADVLVPLAIAMVVWAIVNAVANAMRRLRIGKFALPSWFALFVSLILVMSTLVLVVYVVTQNARPIASEITNMNRINEVMAQITGLFGEPRILTDFFDEAELNNLRAQLVAEAATQLTTIFGTFMLIFVYVLFLLIEQHTFPQKVKALVDEPRRQETFINMFSTLSTKVQYYLWVKTIMSLLTAALSFFVLDYMGVDYALFWAFIVFVLNYIPTIGSILGVILPSLQVLFQFNGDLTPFLIVVFALGVVPQFVVGNLLEPRVMGISLNLSPIVILLSLAFWFAVWKVPGLFLSVPITVIVMIICAHFDFTRGFAVLLSSNGQILDFVHEGQGDSSDQDL